MRKQTYLYLKKTIKGYKTTLSVFFNDLIEMGIIDKNPVDHIKITTKKTKAYENFYDIEELKELYKILLTDKTLIEKNVLGILIAMTTSMRNEEISGLRWESVDYDKNRFAIQQAAVRVKGKTIVKSTKEGDISDRYAIITPIVKKLLKKHEKTEILKRLSLGPDWQGEESHSKDFIFTQANGKIQSPSTLYKYFKKIIKRNNLKEINFHGLRHSAATAMLHSGMDLNTVSLILGHSQPSTTSDIYAHARKNSNDLARDIFTQLENQVLEGNI